MCHLETKFQNANLIERYEQGAQSKIDLVLPIQIKKHNENWRSAINIL